MRPYKAAFAESDRPWSLFAFRKSYAICTRTRLSDDSSSSTTRYHAQNKFQLVTQRSSSTSIFDEMLKMTHCTVRRRKPYKSDWLWRGIPHSSLCASQALSRHKLRIPGCRTSSLANHPQGLSTVVVIPTSAEQADYFCKGCQNILPNSWSNQCHKAQWVVILIVTPGHQSRNIW